MKLSVYKWFVFACRMEMVVTQMMMAWMMTTVCQTGTWVSALFQDRSQHTVSIWSCA